MGPRIRSTLVEVLVSCWNFLRRRYLVLVICFLLALPSAVPTCLWRR